MSSPAAPADRLPLALKCQRSGNSYLNCAEEFVGNSDLLGAHNSPLWAQGFAEDCIEILGVLPGHIRFLKNAFQAAGAATETIAPGNTAYANMQRMAVKYLSEPVIAKTRREFEAAGLPVYGFHFKAQEFMSKKLQIILSFSFGVVFVSAVLVIALLKPEPTSFQFNVFRTVLALAGAGVAAVFPGFIEVEMGRWLRSGGALAVFVVLYFFAPKLLGDDTSKKVPMPSTVNQSAEQSRCSNIVASGKVSVACPDSHDGDNHAPKGPQAR